MKAIAIIVSLAFAIQASADQFKTVSVDMSSKNYEAQISYPELNNTSVPGYKSINKQVLENLANGGCDAQDAAESQNGQDYSASARIIGLNKKYVGYEVDVNSYCGGAHPNYYTYFITYDAQTGEVLDMDKEAPRPNYDDGNFEEYEKYKLELATIMYKALKTDGASTGEDSCYEGMSDDEAIEQVALLWPYVAGLAKGEKVVLAVSPPHVAVPCYFSVRLDYSQVEKYLAKDGKITKWLK